MCTPSTILRVNRDRLWSDLMQLKQIGSYHDEATGLEGVKRLALTDVIPDTATLTIDLRNPVDQQMSAAEEHLADIVRDLTARHGVQTTLDRMAKTAVVLFE
jgi:acetylornithine deacetylase/succinyl-diaminopimelate desuccinylase-like protein